MNNNIVQQLFEAIVAPVLYDEESPYKLMTKKMNDIDVDYFQEGIPLSENLDESFGPTLKKRIFADFSAYGRELYAQADNIECNIIKSIKKMMEFADEREEMIQVLESACRKVDSFATTQLCFVPIPMYNSTELRTLYENAKRITLKERLTHSNNRDVMEYYHALIVHATYVCRMLTRRYAARFLNNVTTKIREDYRETFQSCADTYTPRPVDTTNVSLPNELMPLVERMAENVHEVWSATRIEQGWTYGAERNDSTKTHPCLLPYDQLPEEEKIYDRNTSIETLKFILSQGFIIRKK